MNTEITMNRQTVLVPGTQAAGRLPDFRSLLGEPAWSRLPAAVQSRFQCGAHAGHTTLYTGAMDVAASRLGRAFAHLCRVIGTPVVPFTGTHVSLRVAVFESEDGIVWERQYEFANGKRVVVRSSKQLDHEGGLVEALGAGLRMRLRVYEEGGALHFISTGYYFEALGLRIMIPEWFLPGVTHVIHQDLGSGRFRFTMTTDHRWLGRLYFQDGVFH